MATRRKKKTKRRPKPRPLPNWSLLALGLAVGIALTMLVQLLVQRTGSPDSGLNTLFSTAEESARAAPEKNASSQVSAKTPKPRFDFYTILPEIETVLPQQEAARERKPVKKVPSERLSYVLQAASFARFQDADRLKAKLTLNGLVPHIQKVTIEGKGEYHRVRLGPYSNLKDLDVADRRLRELGIRGLRIKVRHEG